ncbi:MAG: T9SS type A sorting domain-containing protein [Ignavibacteria bacterium]|nr:T9SS type A sorting domain-containing protein [Ignavibacteria bacterium]
MKVRNFSFSSTGRVDYATILGPWNHSSGQAFYRNLATLCGALIEGKYYGDSACLVASSKPLQGAEYTVLTPSLAPNPVSDIATLRFVLPTAQGLTIETYDMLGREVAPPLHFEALSSGMNALPIEMARLPRGAYAVRLRTALGLRATTMMVKE